MATSIFDKKEEKPNDNDLEKVLKTNFNVWEDFVEYLQSKHEVIETEWKFYNKNSGWCLKISNEKGKNIVFLLPNDNYFIVTVNMGVKTKQKVLKTNISEENKELIENAKVYVEGISVLITIRDKKDLEDVKTILNIRDNNKYQ